MRSLKLHFLVTFFLAATFLAGCQKNKMNQDQTTPVAQAAANDADTIHKRAIAVDMHVDSVQRVLDEHVDLQQQLSDGHFDAVRARAGGLDAQFFSIWVEPQLFGGGGARAVNRADDQISAIRALAGKHPETWQLATSADDVRRAAQDGKIAALMGLEGGYAIDEKLENVQRYYDLGVRYMSPAWSVSTSWAGSSGDEIGASRGLNEFGKSVVREMNRLGMMVDLSHTSPATMAAALRVTAAPVIFSHSSARALTDVPRNVPDEILRQVKTNDGIVMVTFVPGFVSQEVADYNKKETDQRARLLTALNNNESAVNAAMVDWRRLNPSPRASLLQVADHIDHIKKIAGIEHIGFGGDFDGITAVVVGLEDVSCYPQLVAELLRRGYSDDDIRKITNRNILRVMREVEGTAARLQGSTSKSVH
jgi:membrane dipeptidase